MRGSKRQRKKLAIGTRRSRQRGRLRLTEKGYIQWMLSKQGTVGLFKGACLVLRRDAEVEQAKVLRLAERFGWHWIDKDGPWK